MHMQAHAHKYTYSTPHTTIMRRTKPGVEWGRVASSFPPPYCTQPGNNEVHYLAKVGIAMALFEAQRELYEFPRSGSYKNDRKYTGVAPHNG
jgi:hypothetical protein